MIAIQTSERNGKLVGAAVLVEPDGEIMLIIDRGVLIRTKVTSIREMGRSTQGVTPDFGSMTALSWPVSKGRRVRRDPAWIPETNRDRRRKIQANRARPMGGKGTIRRRKNERFQFQRRSRRPA